MVEVKEAFLRAIFAARDDDTPRLVYADWLEEHGDPDAAKVIRLSIEVHRCQDKDQRWRLLDEMKQVDTRYPGLLQKHHGVVRWFVLRATDRPFCSVEELLDPDTFRHDAVERPWLFSTEHLVIRGSKERIVDSRPFDTLFSSVALRKVTSLDLKGDDVPIVSSTVTDAGGGLIGRPTYDSRIVPTITLAGVEALASHRGCHRLTHLDLTYNQLGNDALRYLARSPHLENLEHLSIAAGNNFRGRVWQLLIEQFGEDVVS